MISLEILSMIVFLSLVLHYFIVIPIIKRYITSLSIYIIIISLIIITDLLLIFIDNHSILLIIDSLLTGILLALLIWIYSLSWCTFHLFLTILVIGLGYFSPKNDLFINRSYENLLVIFIELLHGISVFLHGFRTYMHRLIALSGLCLTFYLLVFERMEINWKIFIQSIRAFLLYSIVICVRNRTSYW